MADEQVTCQCEEDAWVYLEAGYSIQAISTGSTFVMPEAGWVRWEDRGNSPTPWHMWVGEDGEILYCDRCGTGLLSTGTTQARVDAVTSEAALLNDAEWGAVIGAFEEYANECCVNPSKIVDALKQYRAIGDAALSGGTVTLAAVEWLAKLLAQRLEAVACDECPVDRYKCDNTPGACYEVLVAAALAHAQAADAGQPREPRHSADTFMAGGYKESGSDE